MGRFHYHADGTGHSHDDDDHDHDSAHEHDHRHEGGVGDHSGYTTGGLRVDVLEKILGENDHTAEANRSDFAEAHVHVVNMMSSPGAGKTTLLREVLLHIGATLRVGIVEGDVETSIDADRLAGLGAPVSLINTANGFGGECHLDATMVRSALPRLPLADLDLLIIENVGNLVCPAEFDVGEDARAMVFSITEGEEKPLKYPVMFRSADLVVVNKIDLLPHLDFDLAAFYSNLRDVNPHVRTIETSAKTGLGVDDVCNWLRALADHG
ncbi:MAG: hydrogenase nickel incorporation protein HypB [Acidimicrobiaceae bacterium]|nr:MAG: hydrogenase nickel incorporation protein HypB [Acidimicrobiaceae bacterium]